MPKSTPVWHAVNGNKPDAVKLLLERGAKHIYDTICPIHRAIIDGRIDILNILMDHRYIPLDVIYPGLNKQHMIHVAACIGNVDIVKMLLAYGIDPNVRQSTNGWTPLMHAADKDNMDVVKVLLDACIKMSIESKK